MSLENKKLSENELKILAVNNFREYLKIPSVHPNINYEPCVLFLQKQAKTLGLPLQVYYCVPKKPIVILTWIGHSPALPTILLNGHMDVVPVFEYKWNYPPFGSVMDEQRNIYGRGAQDMKSVSIQYLEAIRKLKNDGVVLKRTIHISFVPDEEIGGKDGMAAFVKTDYFKKLNVGFALDEGMASPTNDYFLAYGERTSWKLKFQCPGQSGHGSLLYNNTPGQKLEYLLGKLYRFREMEKQKLTKNPSLSIGDVTTLNVTQLLGGVQSNVIPEKFTFVVDCRLPLTVSLEAWENTLNGWCVEAGKGVSVEFEEKQRHVPATKLDNTNLYWLAFKKATDKLKLRVNPQIMGGMGDSRFLRELDIPVINFSPMNKTPVLLHDHDEFVNQDTFLNGISIYTEILMSVANVELQQQSKETNT